MRLQKQLLDQNWFACPEAPDSSDLSLYTHTFERAVCKTSNIPLTLAGLFLSSKTPLWCYHIFKTDLRADPLHRLHLCFDRVVCLCQVWVNGIWIGQHNHSEEAFSMDITDALTDGENLIACRIYAPITGEIGPEGISMKTTPNYAQIYSYYPVVPKTGIFGHVALEKNGRQNEIALIEKHGSAARLRAGIDCSLNSRRVKSNTVRYRTVVAHVKNFCIHKIPPQ